MRYFVPDIRVASELPAQSCPQDKFGGLPWGLALDAWPKCRTCGRSQSLLAQFLHHSARLDLGREGRSLFAFQCNHDPGRCASWDRSAGANACFVVEPEDLHGGRLTPVPADHPSVEREVQVVRWIERDDGLPDALAAAFYDLRAYDALDDAHLKAVTWSSRMGGVPRWVQTPAGAPPQSAGWRFVGQLDSTYSFLSPPLIDVPWVLPDPDRYEGRTHLAVGPNFGDGGIAYLFLRSGPTLPEGSFHWQCL